MTNPALHSETYMKLLDSRTVPAFVVAIGLAVATVCTMLFPEVEGLGSKVRLPVFHGAMTWVNLLAFSGLGLLGVAYLVRRRDGVYRWLEALRWVAVVGWLTGSVLGLIAALRTWDFTGTTESPLVIAAEDPRMVAQFWILILGLAVLAIGLLIEERPWLAAVDVGFVAVSWTILLRAILGPGRALHPDSPVMNSDEIFIKAMFIGIFAGLFIAFSGVVWLVRSLRAPRYADSKTSLGNTDLAAERA